MNKQEISELKKQLNLRNCNIQKMALCHVDKDKTKRIQDAGAFLVHPEEEIEEYLSIFKQTMTGGIGKKLLNLDFKENKTFTGSQKLLEQIRKSELEDKNALEEFYDKMIESYQTEQEYFIIMVYGCYDVPIRHPDNSYEKDSAHVYQYIQCAICTIDLSKRELTYVGEKNELTMGNRNIIVGKPEIGFLYPSFHERAADCYHILFYTKDTKRIPESVIAEVLQCKTPLAAYKQKKYFDTILSMSLADRDPKTINEIQKSIAECEKERLDEDSLCQILKVNGIGESEMQAFREKFKEMVRTTGSREFVKTNISNKKTMINMGNVQISAPVEESFFTIEKVNGRRSIVIPVSETVLLNDVTCN